jgi:hypothetical protein
MLNKLEQALETTGIYYEEFKGKFIIGRYLIEIEESIGKYYVVDMASGADVYKTKQAKRAINFADQN